VRPGRGADAVFGRSGTSRAFRPSAVFLGLLAVWVAGGVLAWLEIGSATVDLLLFVLAGWVVSLSLHEYSHALFAYHSGDRSVANRGYLTLNPLKYTHPLLSIVLPLVFLLLGGIGLPGGAVWVNNGSLRGRRAVSLVSLVGPGANVVFLVLLALPFILRLDTNAHPTFYTCVAFLAFLQLTAAVLNLIPLPGLDGGNAVRPWLNGDWAKIFDTVAPFGLLILFGLIFEPHLNAVFFSVVYLLSDAIGVPRDLVNQGWSLLRFW
jgi:Zn-dependent protease